MAQVQALLAPESSSEFDLQLKKDMDCFGMDAFIEKYDQLTLKDYLVQELNYTDEELAMDGSMKLYNRLYDASMATFGLTRVCGVDATTTVTFPGGMDALAVAMAAELSENIRLNTKAERITQKEDGVTVE